MCPGQRDEDYERHERAARGRDLARDEGIERWQGSTEAQIASMGASIAVQESTVAQLRDRMTDMQVQLATVKTQVGVWSAIGGLIGAGLVSIVVFIATGHIR